MALNWDKIITDTVSSLSGLGDENTVNGAIEKITGKKLDSENLDMSTIIHNIQQLVKFKTSTPDTLTGGTKALEISADAFAWDPRLARVDGFLVKQMKGDNSANGDGVIIPFASSSAASAYYNLMFTIEAAAYKKLADANGGSGDADIDLTEIDKANAGIRVGMLGKQAGEKAHIKNDPNLYGTTSLVNPYSITKLCGALKLTLAGGQVKVSENRMYDIRNIKRFYDLNVDTNNDFASITNPTTTNIIRWSNNDTWGRTPYSFLDFVFCKYWKIIPNNRLITLRKYHAPVYDNLQWPTMHESESDLKSNPNSTNQSSVNGSATSFAPIATVLTYFGEETGNTLLNLMGFTTGVKWKEIQSGIHEVSGDSGSDPHAVIDDMFTNGGGFPGGESNIIGSLIGKTNFLTGKIFSFGKFSGLLEKGGYNINQDLEVFEKCDQSNVDPQDQLYSNRIQGPVNRIDTTKQRDAGITFDLKMSIVCEYVARPIGGVNVKAAMLDILGNCMEIASADAMWWGGGYKFMIKPHMYPFKNNKFKNTIMDDLYKGKIFGSDGALSHALEGVKSLGDDGSGSFDWDNVTKNIGNFLGTAAAMVGDMLSSVASAIFGDNNSLSGLIDSATDKVADGNLKEEAKKKNKNLFGNLNQMWRAEVIKKSTMPSINGMKALLTGDPVGNWHLTVGNPLNPIMTVGNLICIDMKVEFSDELGPDDFPMEMKVTYQLEHGMPRDKGGIQSMFNRGNGKIYELPDYIRATSDYETKVDNYTGNMSKAGWTTPGFMNCGSMMGKSGQGGGYKTYKMSPPKELAINANTNNTIITKFTPVTPGDAYINVGSDEPAFINTARAVVRGTQITRKLMQ